MIWVVSPRRALKLGKIRRRACLRLIPFPGIDDVLLAPTMISHPLAYVAPNPRQLGSSSLSRVFCVCKTGLHPLKMDVELITPDHHVVSGHDELWQRRILRENTFILKFSERSSYNATVNQSKIRCIKDKHHMQSKYVT